MCLSYLFCSVTGWQADALRELGARGQPAPRDRCSPDSGDSSQAGETSAAPVTALFRGTVSEDRSVLCVRCPVRELLATPNAEV